MNRIVKPHRPLIALLAAIIVLGSSSAAFARPQDGEADDEERRARKELRKQRVEARHQAQQELPAQLQVEGTRQGARHERVDAAVHQPPEERRARAMQQRESSARVEQRQHRRLDGNVDLRQAVAERDHDVESERRALRDHEEARRFAQQRREASQRESRQRHAREDSPPAVATPHRRDGRDWDRRDDRGDRNARLSGDHQRRLIEQQRQQAIAWQHAESRRRSQLEQRVRDLERQRRLAQYRYQQDYYRRWLAQQSRWNASRYDYYNDPFYSTPANYRYGYGGNWYNTNRHGANVLQQAIRDGYQEGWRAGRADRMDGWRFDYRNSFAYQDGSYGYTGRYVDQRAYQHYFRQGFQRGYDDAYYSRSQYGRYDRDIGLAAILPVILSAILGIRGY